MRIDSAVGLSATLSLGFAPDSTYQLAEDHRQALRSFELGIKLENVLSRVVVQLDGGCQTKREIGAARVDCWRVGIRGSSKVGESFEQ